LAHGWAKGGTGLVNYLGNVFDPRSAEYNRLLGDRMPELRNALVTANPNIAPLATAGERVLQLLPDETIYPALQNKVKDATANAVEAFNRRAAERAAIGKADGRTCFWKGGSAHQGEKESKDRGNGII